MKTLINKLVLLKNEFLKLLNKYLNEILVFAVTSVAAFFVFIFFDISNSIEKNEIMKQNSELMLKNIMLNYRDKQRVIIMQRLEIEKETYKRNLNALLNGNYTQNENNKQREYKVVGEPEEGNLGL